MHVLIMLAALLAARSAHVPAAEASQASCRLLGALRDHFTASKGRIDRCHIATERLS